MGSKNKKYQPNRVSRTTRSQRPGTVVIVMLIIILTITGLYLILEPIIGRWQQDRASQQLIDNFENGDGTIIIDHDQFVVAGEEYDYYEDVIETSEQTTETSESTPSSETTQTEETTQPTETTVAPTTTATDEKVVVTAIAKIRIPSISVNMPVAEGATLYNLRVAIGHYTNSPSAGEPGVAIYLGHRSYTYGRHFNRMGEVEIGDTIVIETKTHRYTYEVDQIDVVEPDALLYEFNNRTLEPRIMLVTCEPIRVASHRMLVKGALINTEVIG